MHAAGVQEKPSTIVDQAETPPLEIIENQAGPLAVAHPTASYTLGTDAPWPDQGLNRILATVDNFGTPDFSEVECLEMLFYLSSKRPDVRLLAEAALKAYGSLAKVFERPGSELRELLGLDHAMTAQLAISKRSMKFILAAEMSDRKDLRSYAALMNYLTLDLRAAEQEILRIIYLDTKSKIIRDEEMARGTVDEVPIYPREIAKRAVSYCASSVILAHNHLSDDPTPSTGDIQATLMTRGALELLEIALHDHVIVARKSCFSMRQECLL